MRLRALSEDAATFITSAEEYAGRTRESVAAQLAPSNSAFTLGAFLDGELVGVATLARAERFKQRHRADVTGIYLAPEARGQGAAKALLGELIRRARAVPELEVLELGVTETQGAARQLYLALGFEIWGVQRGAVWRDNQRWAELHRQLWLR